MTILYILIPAYILLCTNFGEKILAKAIKFLTFWTLMLINPFTVGLAVMFAILVGTFKVLT